VVRVPEQLRKAIEAHRQKLQAERPFENVTMAGAVRDLLAQALAKARKRR
jgi:hypothetical protein